jgi:hemin uptake protein HemP
MPNLLDNYDLYGEAVITTDAWWKLFRDAMKEMIDVRVKSGGRLYANFSLNYLVEVLEREARRLDQLFRIGRVMEALQSPLRDRTLFSPDGRLIVVLNGRAYTFKKSILELLESKSASVVDFLEKLERSELRPLAKAADLLGIGLLFVELERRGLLPESLGDDKKVCTE